MESNYLPLSLTVLNTNVEEQKIISTNKFTILCIATFGLYTIWWQYKVWRFSSSISSPIAGQCFAPSLAFLPLPNY
ncbi:hypothetical protein SAMN00120144_1666 [Hymenobacter roseosalivarius DSM 11622]|uniref:DUF4234 domain-containing protein n=1 Tax=Hymenobacter roseosalivarius DSM 11622 TaxID=645990 RepID=A0A1W1W3R6_9BACT|nr:hypothetical protein SAMN00120144_1666 [Hymenobacter roseosalivarius DSM 11622]